MCQTVNRPAKQFRNFHLQAIKKLQWFPETH